ncbi:EpsI family protein [Desulfacinum hydrothermale DSM 13146]|uniref:EpsI family protein n=1 Tax=Desulfacinum hydrothermale DSM 13146 TaxID=1121390 RepID=A0A1W1XQM9_9BACT|nr:exosortase C-terminal domain/associated protein EpsI [Desulfacinum hydrothermale]SMC26263.1 EpsI family protein [Desulfacinum hydrothermale DSM 13146]
MTTVRGWIPALVVALLLSGAWAATKDFERIPELKPLKPLGSIPTTLGPYAGHDLKVDAYVQKVLEPTDMLFRTYTDPAGTTVGLFITFHGKQTSEFHPHSPKLCMPGSGWFAEKVERRTIDLGGGRKTRVIASVYERAGEREVFFYWFQTGRRTVANEYLQKLWMVVDGLTRHRTDVAFIRLSTRAEGPATERAQARLEDFLRRLQPHLDAVLPH